MARSFDPLREMESWFSQVNRLPATVAMPMDLYRDNDKFVARIDLPGVDPASIDVDIDGRTLTVRAQRAADVLSDQARWLTRERPAGTFARQLTLGYDVALDGIEADYSDGVLTLHIPVAEEARPRKVAVQHVGGVKPIEATTE
ncbi:Hsp20/alpha crystallin family protein [Propionicicella superfundia]|uniref:Hsp20/alpha crystallin family protein n=1 Tax=Propionicicella superfundia TaxID=348582 RepID=UPI000409F25F|nr:Hsp20/alpha crystallin family protein [Propionicicella superfundia]